MLREEQIDLRRQRAKTGKFVIENTSKKKVFSDYRVTNPATGGKYTVTIRGFDTGDNSCTCPDYKANTLGTCKHILAVVESLDPDLSPHTKKKKAPITRPEVYLQYGEQLQLGLHLPARHSDKLGQLSKRFFDESGLWSGRGRYEDLIPAIEVVHEEVTVLSDALDFIDREIELQEMQVKERDWLDQIDAGKFDTSLLRVPLYDYQIRGALFLACRGRAILGDDMGLGKTVQTLAAVELLARERGISRVLVVAPSSVKYQWQSEIQKFTNRNVQVIDGSQGERVDQYELPTFYRLVNYEQVVRDREAINDWKPDLIVLDEAQRIKNWESKTSKSVKKLQSRYAFVLTGTPLENSLEELYSIVQFVDERRFGPAFQFLYDHRMVNKAGEFTGYRNLEVIREKLEPIFLRRTRAEVLTQLPARTESNLVVELGDAQRGPYEEQRLTLGRFLEKPHLTDLDRKRILACISNMRLICDSLFLFDKETHFSPKLEEFKHLAVELTEKTEHKLVVFSQWETMLNETADMLDRLDIRHVVLHGGLSGLERRQVLELFNNDETCRVFLSTDAGGTGLNLQVADTVVNLELPWNPAVLEQRIARVHRMGQDQPVRVINFVTRGTIEENVLRAMEVKRGLFASLFESTDDEVTMTTGHQRQFIQTLQELVNEAQPKPEPVSQELSNLLGDKGLPLVETALPLLETLAKWLRSPEVQPHLTDDMKQRLTRLLR